MSDALSLASLFASSFLSATLLPGSSEVVLVAMLLSGVSQPWLLVVIATMGNSLGGLTNVILGRFFPLREKSRWQEKAVGWLKRYGAATLLLSWMPVIGDLLCLLADGCALLGTCLFFVPWQGVALCPRGMGNTTGYDVVALIGGMNTRPSIVNHYNYAE